jgi:hypothetical protein
VLLELLCPHDVGVVAPAGPEFMVEKIESCWRLGHRIDLDARSNIFLSK